MNGRIRIVESGPSSTIQDRGRTGWFHAGVGVSGAADRKSCALANRLVANDPDAAAIECLIGGMQFVAETETTFAVTGAQVHITVDGMTVGMNSVVTAPAGARVALGTAQLGLRAYVAFRGGIDVEPVLGSRSYDSLSQIGPPPLSFGDVLPLGRPPLQWPIIDVAPVAPTSDEPVRVLLGPRDDWFDNPEDLFTGRWTVSDQTDRVGMRLQAEGQELRRIDSRELPSEGMVLGSIQVQPNGDLVVFLADHPITGGYPVVGTVLTSDVDNLSQVRPGETISFCSASRRC